MTTVLSWTAKGCCEAQVGTWQHSDVTDSHHCDLYGVVMCPRCRERVVVGVTVRSPKSKVAVVEEVLGHVQ